MHVSKYIGYIYLCIIYKPGFSKAIKTLPVECKRKYNQMMNASFMNYKNIENQTNQEEMILLKKKIKFITLTSLANQINVKKLKRI